MYALEMGVKTPAEINGKWPHAMKNPIKPVEVQEIAAPDDVQEAPREPYDCPTGES
jgi:hypothetical protein